MSEFIGTDDNDIIDGEDGDDTLIGGRGADTMTGGAGSDLFVIDHAESSATDALGDGQVDVITDFTVEDRILFSHAMTPDENALYAGVADDYAGAYDQAQDAFALGYEYASIKVGGDVFVFAPRTDSVVMLAGVDPDVVTGASMSGEAAQGDDATLSVLGELYQGGMGADTVQGLEGADTIVGGDGGDRILAGDGDDSLDGGAGLNYLRGEQGEDMIYGGAQHDDINGNQGNDTLFAGAGDDWVRGGKGDDVVSAGSGDDLAFGDIGDDTVNGGEGNDVVHGGDGQDVLRGDDGNDTLVGDAGNDTLDGGNGADVFVAQAGGGNDLVLAFSVSDGDHVLVADGASYAVAQEGDDVVITLDGGRMVLAGVQLDSLPEGWIFAG